MKIDTRPKLTAASGGSAFVRYGHFCKLAMAGTGKRRCVICTDILRSCRFTGGRRMKTCNVELARR